MTTENFRRREEARCKKNKRCKKRTVKIYDGKHTVTNGNSAHTIYL